MIVTLTGFATPRSATPRGYTQSQAVASGAPRPGARPWCWGRPFWTTGVQQVSTAEEAALRTSTAQDMLRWKWEECVCFSSTATTCSFAPRWVIAGALSGVCRKARGGLLRVSGHTGKRSLTHHKIPGETQQCESIWGRILQQEMLTSLCDLHLEDLTITRKGKRVFFFSLMYLRFQFPLQILDNNTGNALEFFHVFSVHGATFRPCLLGHWVTETTARPGFCQRQKWAEVKVQPGSYGVMLSVGWKDKHRRRGKEMKGDKRDWWECGMLMGGGISVLNIKGKGDGGRFGVRYKNGSYGVNNKIWQCETILQWISISN